MNTGQNKFLIDELQSHTAIFNKLDRLFPHIIDVADVLRTTIRHGGKILLMGNGGSAADSQHIAAEIVGRYKKERRGLPAIALTTDTSIITCVGNDYSFEYIFARQIEALCRPEDSVFGISTSGNSKNVTNAIIEANSIGATTIGLTGGTGGELLNLCKFNLVIPSNETARIQEAHIFIGHCLCAMLEAD